MIPQEEPIVPLVTVEHQFLIAHRVRLSVLREDLIHPYLSGNKWRKLKYNLIEAKRLQHTALLTFGGAYSNHIRAVAFAGKAFGFRTIGMIRGEETLPLNPSLAFAKSMGMEIYYLDRTTYRQKTDNQLLDALRNRFGNFYLIPEGGTNLLALKGCAEIWKNIPDDANIVCCACGTGGTLAGLIAGAPAHVSIWGFAALKGGHFLQEDIDKLLQQTAISPNKMPPWEVITTYHFGGYAKSSPLLTNFIHDFTAKTKIPIEFIYTGKMFYGIFDLIATNQIPENTHLVAIHTGGIWQS